MTSYPLRRRSWKPAKRLASLAALVAGSALVCVSCANATSGQWTNVPRPDAGPSPRSYQSMTGDPNTGKLYLFGGSYAEDLVFPAERYLNDLWAYDPATNTWTELEPSGSLPAARKMAQMVYASDRQSLIMYGGEEETTAPLWSGDLWEYDIADNRWTELQPTGAKPAPREFCAMAYDEATRKVLLFGGRYTSDSEDNLSLTFENLNDLWAYDPAANTWTELHPSGKVPAPRARALMAYDPQTARTMLLGGGSQADQMDADTTHEDLWAYDPVKDAWAQLKSSGGGPPEHSLYVAYDQALRKLILLYAKTDSVTQKTSFGMWSYDPTTNLGSRVEVSGALPPFRPDGSLVYGAGIQELLLYGGTDSNKMVKDITQPLTYFQDFWAWSDTP